MKFFVCSLKNKYQSFIVIEIRVRVDISEENSKEKLYTKSRVWNCQLSLFIILLGLIYRGIKYDTGHIFKKRVYLLENTITIQKLHLFSPLLSLVAVK